MYIGLLRIDALVRIADDEELGQGVKVVEIEGEFGDLLVIVREAGSMVCEGAEFNHPDAGVFIENESGLVVSLQKKEARWSVVHNYSGVATDTIRDAFIRPHG